MLILRTCTQGQKHCVVLHILSVRRRRKRMILPSFPAKGTKYVYETWQGGVLLSFVPALIGLVVCSSHFLISARASTTRASFFLICVSVHTSQGFIICATFSMLYCMLNWVSLVAYFNQQSNFHYAKQRTQSAFLLIVCWSWSLSLCYAKLRPWGDKFLESTRVGFIVNFKTLWGL